MAETYPPIHFPKQIWYSQNILRLRDILFETHLDLCMKLIWIIGPWSWNGIEEKCFFLISDLQISQFFKLCARPEYPFVHVR